MNLDNIYSNILKICKENYIVEPYIVGGVPRNLYLNLQEERDSFYANSEDEFRDIDITTNDSETTRLGITCADYMQERFKFFKDGHLTIYIKDAVLDFSSNFISVDVVDYITKELNIKDRKLFEVYSRDFTINTLHKKFFDDKILDFINKGKEDLDNKILRTPVPARITLNDDFRRVFRSINFAARFGLSIDGDIIDYTRENRDKFTGENKWVLKEAFITSIIGESINKNADITMHYLSEMNLLPTVPLVGNFKEELIKRKLINKYLDDVINLSEYKLKTLNI
jgi:hypothetical protein